jgi:hypothetical protein
MMFCPGCGSPHSKTTQVCPECDTDLAQGHPPTKAQTYAQEKRSAQMLVARQEAALLKIPQRREDETEEGFIRRVVNARTKQLDDQVRAMTVSALHA